MLWAISATDAASSSAAAAKVWTLSAVLPAAWVASLASSLERANGSVDLAEVLLDHPVQVGKELDLCGDVGGELHDLVGPAAGVEDRIVARLRSRFPVRPCRCACTGRP